MEFAKPLPSYLVTRYHGWKATSYEENQGWYQPPGHRRPEAAGYGDLLL